MRVKGSFVTYLIKQLAHNKANKRDFVRDDNDISLIIQ